MAVYNYIRYINKKIEIEYKIKKGFYKKCIKINVKYCKIKNI